MKPKGRNNMNDTATQTQTPSNGASKPGPKKKLNAKEQAQLAKHLKAYLALLEERKSYEQREAQIAQEIYELTGSGKITLKASKLELSAIRVRTSDEGVDPVTYKFYMKHYGEAAPKNVLDL